MDLPELFVINLGILVVHQDAKDASQSGFLTLEYPMAELLRRSKQELNLGFQDPEQFARPQPSLFNVPEILMADRWPPDDSLIVPRDPSLHIEIRQEVPQIMTECVGESIDLLQDVLAKERGLHSDVIQLGEKAVGAANMLVRTIHDVGTSCVPHYIKFSWVELVLSLAVSSLNHVFGELLHHIEGTWTIKSDTFHIPEVQVHVTIVNTKFSKIGPKRVPSN